jgi:F-type H+-transporting ATPase subunit alpha
MKQRQYTPLSVADMALSLYAVNEGYLDNVEVGKVLAFEEALHDYAKTNHGATLDAINESGDYDDAVAATLKSICDDFAEKGAF